MSTSKLSLRSAILVNLNIMLGSGIFINTVLLAKNAGGLGAMAYGAIGLLMLPLIRSIAGLMRILGGGTFYDFGSVISPLWGFIASWSYFAGKLASCALSLHIFTTLMQCVFPAIKQIPTLALDGMMLALFVFANFQNLKIGRSIQYGFVTLKLIPLFFVIFSGLRFFSLTNYSGALAHAADIIGTVPFILFAFGGFEASCSLSDAIENPEKNGPRAMYLSYSIVLCLMIIYQLSFFGIFGNVLGSLGSFSDAFTLLTEKYGALAFVQALILSCIASSALGASYGIMFSNAWNLHALAQRRLVAGSSLFMKKNQNGIPVFCVIAEALIAGAYLLFFHAHQVPLQQTSALGSTVSYTISALAFAIIAIARREERISAFLALGTCSIFIAGALRNSIVFGAKAYALFFTVVAIGIVQYVILRKKTGSKD